jgi:hypothetical protein
MIIVKYKVICIKTKCYIIVLKIAETKNKYQSAKIYTIRCYIEPYFIYIGTCCQPLHKVWYQHKHNVDSFSPKNQESDLNEEIKELGFDKFYIELYKTCKCENKEELN